jgi:hypothetical protein
MLIKSYTTEGLRFLIQITTLRSKSSKFRSILLKKFMKGFLTLILLTHLLFIKEFYDLK